MQVVCSGGIAVRATCLKQSRLGLYQHLTQFLADCITSTGTFMNTIEY